MDKQKFYQCLRLCLVILSLICVYLLMKYTVSFLFPFLLAVILSLILNRPVTFLEKTFKFPRGIAVFIMLSVTVTTIIGLIILILSELIHGTAYLAEVVPNHFRSLIFIAENFIDEQLMPSYHNLVSFFHALNPEQQESINTNINQIMQQFASFGADVISHLLHLIPQTIALLPRSISMFLFTVMAAFFITKDWESLIWHIKKRIPKNILDTSFAVQNHLRNALFGYIRAQSVLIVITSLTILIGLLIFQVEYALTISLLAALADLLPFFGTGIIFVPWILYLFLTGDYVLTIAITVLYMIVVIQRQLLEPKIVSGNVGVNPLFALLALFIGFQIWGAIGFFIGPLLLFTVNAFFQAGIFHQIGHFIKNG
ncbi:sporulation integral membrane protein YtvI [Lentibacillus amyloliquefaciens]|uniref:Sporulation integral membrane protein YtvI n=1 Tax=Lentibacillus amyloliquefaciens TaxID=1472767 RepID=A0A0U4F444_9BACI|nr:sporulation integral membrane protein YtvI [Lentibacillus amyloliquefaciens]ALX48342.1 hypothetical protein AOX59_06800 [Lentibacillus amyloliquefaciens]